MRTPQREILSAERLAAIAWLNSPEGRRWSRDHFTQSSHAKKMFSLKEDRPDCGDSVPDMVWTDWGRVDKMGRYCRPRPQAEPPRLEDAAER